MARIETTNQIHKHTQMAFVSLRILITPQELNCKLPKQPQSGRGVSLDSHEILQNDGIRKGLGWRVSVGRNCLSSSFPDIFTLHTLTFLDKLPRGLQLTNFSYTPPTP